MRIVLFPPADRTHDSVTLCKLFLLLLLIPRKSCVRSRSRPLLLGPSFRLLRTNPIGKMILYRSSLITSLSAPLVFREIFMTVGLVAVEIPRLDGSYATVPKLIARGYHIGRIDVDCRREKTIVQAFLDFSSFLCKGSSPIGSLECAPSQTKAFCSLCVCGRPRFRRPFWILTTAFG